mgnify:CR=1 FL=1
MKNDAIKITNFDWENREGGPSILHVSLLGFYEVFGVVLFSTIRGRCPAIIPQLTAKYTPSAILKTSVLWSIWLAWCKLFYENQTEFEVFYDNIINGTFSTLRTRINEFPATIQWIEIIRNRRKGGEFEGISEKEFLLSHSTKVKKYQDFVSMGEIGRAHV